MKRRIAVYGKGGIGKSTLAANLSAALGLAGWKVLQIGCDPKQDSTRLLLGGSTIATALDYLRRTPPEDRSLDAIVHAGFAGVSCVEAGGPEPGVGCAGRGILSALDLLEQLGIERLQHDFILYDVLGDVVCGGFAVPLRDEYAELVFIVTSGEFMALYAANNILRGIRNFEGRGMRVGGILFNERGLEDEIGRVERFAQAVKLPIVARFPRSGVFAVAEQEGRTIIASRPKSRIAGLFRKLADYTVLDPPRFSACPLAPLELERVVHGIFRKAGAKGRGTGGAAAERGEIAARESRDERDSFSPSPLHAFPEAVPPANAPPAPFPPPKRYCSKGVRTQSVLFGCAFNGAAHTVMQIRNATTIVHGPRSCTYLSSQGLVSLARRLRDHYGTTFGPGGIPDLECSQMDEHTVIFGGNASLEECLRRAVARNGGPLFVVTTCSSGIIGDDARVAVKTATEGCKHVPVLLLPTDGDITGDYMQGVLDAMRAVAEEWIDPHVEPEGDAVNIVAEKNLALNTEENFETVRRLLNALGVRINCRFIRRCSIDEIRGFKKGTLNLLAHDDAFGRVVRGFLVDRFSMAFASYPFPVGCYATGDWLREIARFFQKPDSAEPIIEHCRAAYEASIARLRPGLEGKRVFIAAQNYRIDWVLETALDLGMEVVKVGIVESVWDDNFMSRFVGRVPLVFPYPREQREEDMHALRPDLTLVNYAWRKMPEGFRFDNIPVCPDLGPLAGTSAAERWLRLMKLPASEGWRHDV